MTMKYQIDNSHIDHIPSAFLYRQTMDYYPKSAIGCFIISDRWNEQALLGLKEKSGAWFLVGLQIDDIDFERLDIIGGVIRCQPDEVNNVIKLLDISSASTIIGIDVVDIRSYLIFVVHSSSFQFIQASATGKSESDLIKVTTHKLVNQLATVRNTKGVFIGMESVQSLPIEAFAYISEAVEELLSNDEVSIYYRSSMTDEINTFRLKMIYALA